jgi:glycopeptide antibiotics resistance protein
MRFWRLLCLAQFFALLVIFIFLGLTGEPGNYVPMFNDKLMHCSGYIVAGISISFAFPLWKLWWRAAFLILFSLGIEIGQHFLPPRTFDLYDLCANSTGVMLGLCFVAWMTQQSNWFRSLRFLNTSAHHGQA